MYRGVLWSGHSVTGPIRSRSDRTTVRRRRMASCTSAAGWTVLITAPLVSIAQNTEQTDAPRPGLVPNKAIPTDETWKLGNDVVQSLCQFEALIANEVTAKLEEVTDGYASISIGGRASGIELGALAKVTISARAKYEILAKRLV